MTPFTRMATCTLRYMYLKCIEVISFWMLFNEECTQLVQCTYLQLLNEENKIIYHCKAFDMHARSKNVIRSPKKISGINQP